MFSSESNELMFEKAGCTRGHYGGMVGLHWLRDSEVRECHAAANLTGIEMFRSSTNAGLVVPQALCRIDLRRAPSGNAGRQQRDKEQQERDGAECQRIAGAHAEEKTLHQPHQQ